MVASPNHAEGQATDERACARFQLPQQTHSDDPRFPPGGPTDVVARIIGPKMADQLDQAVVIDNKPGVGGNIAADIVAKAAPDG